MLPLRAGEYKKQAVVRWAASKGDLLFLILRSLLSLPLFFDSVIAGLTA
jgi:hypothetical protein